MILSPSLRESPVKLISSKDSYDDWVCTLYLKLLYLPLQGSYLDQCQYLSQSHQPTHNTRLMPKIYISSRALGHHQEVHYHVDNTHPLLLSEIQAHHCRSLHPPSLQHLNSQTPIVLIHHNIVHIPPAYHRLFSNPGNSHHFEQI